MQSCELEKLYFSKGLGNNMTFGREVGFAAECTNCRTIPEILKTQCIR